MKTKAAIFNLVGTIINKKHHPIPEMVNIINRLYKNNYLIGAININGDSTETEFIMDTIRYLPIDAYISSDQDQIQSNNLHDTMIKELMTRWHNEYKTDYIQLTYMFGSNLSEINNAINSRSKYIIGVAYDDIMMHNMISYGVDRVIAVS